MLFLAATSCLTERDRNGRRNLENVKQVSLGMDTVEVKKVMGIPDKKWRSLNNKLVYDYLTPSGSSEYISITFDSLTYKVIDKGRQYEEN